MFLSDDYSRLLDISDETTIYDIVRDSPDNPNNVGATLKYVGHVKTLPFGIYDADVYQLYCLFSPDFGKHFDVDAIQKQWVIRESISGEVYFRCPTTFLSYDPKDENKIHMQTRFIHWEGPLKVGIIDVNAKPHIHEILEIPNVKDDGLKLSYEIAAGAEPYLDTEFFLASYKNNQDKRPLGIFNYFKGV